MNTQELIEAFLKENVYAQEVSLRSYYLLDNKIKIEYTFTNDCEHTQTRMEGFDLLDYITFIHSQK